MLDQQTKQRITAEETARFMDDAFGQLDLSGSPDLTHPVTETFELQDRHGFNRVDESGLAGINRLKELLANPPQEVVEELARETGNPELVAQLADERASDIAREFRRRNPDYLKCDSNWRSIVEAMAHDLLGEDVDADEAQDLLVSQGCWTLPNLKRPTKVWTDLEPLTIRPISHAHSTLRSDFAPSNWLRTARYLAGSWNTSKDESVKKLQTKLRLPSPILSPSRLIRRCAQFSKKRAGSAGKLTGRTTHHRPSGDASCGTTVPVASSRSHYSMQHGMTASTPSKTLYDPLSSLKLTKRRKLPSVLQCLSIAWRMQTSMTSTTEPCANMYDKLNATSVCLFKNV
jgi:hypothetical protein